MAHSPPFRVESRPASDEPWSEVPGPGPYRTCEAAKSAARAMSRKTMVYGPTRVVDAAGVVLAHFSAGSAEPDPPRQIGTNVGRVAGLLGAVKRERDAIAGHRDQLRELVRELDEILESCDRGVEGMDEAVRLLEDGVDSISEYL